MSPGEKRCPRCDARMAPQQDWCLQCGAAATTRIVAPPDWRLAVAIVLGVVAVAGIVVAIVVGSLGGGSDKAVAGASGATQATTAHRSHHRRARAQVATTATTSTTATATSATTSTVAGGAAAGDGAVPLWPSGKQAYSVIAITTPDRKAAEQRARQLIAKGRDAGILRSDGYDFFSPGAWAVYVGKYKDKPAAQAALAKLSADIPSGYVTLVRRRP